MYEKIGYCVVLITVGFLAWQDIKTRKISILGLILSGIIAIFYLFVQGKLGIIHILNCMLPGMLLLVLSVISGEKIGYGDGATVLIVGLWTNMEFCIKTLIIAFFLTGCYAGILLFKKRKEEKIPFIPFLLSAVEVLLFFV